MFRHPHVRRPVASLMLGLTLGACSHFRVDTRPVPEVVATNPNNEIIQVKTREAHMVEVSEPRLERDTLFGYTRDGKSASNRPVAFPLRDVESLSTRHFNALGSAGVFVVVLAGVAVIIGLASSPSWTFMH